MLSGSDGGSMMRSLSEISEEGTVKLSADLVAAARRNLGFLRLVSESHWLHNTPTILESIRRYDQLWMPLISSLSNESSTPPMILPPLDVEWVWFCHTLNPVSYRQYCESRFSKLIGKAAIFNEENEEYALNRCKKNWVCKYPSEPFENESDPNNKQNTAPTVLEDLVDEVLKHRHLYTKFLEPYYSEIVYLIAARQRYKGFLYMMHKFADSCSVLVATSGILLMWITHQSYPTVYALDTKELEEEMRKVVGAWEVVKEEDIEDSKKLWERIFDQPYEKAGGVIGRADEVKPPICWEVAVTDVNTKYSSMLPRFLLEVCVTVRLKSNTKILSSEGSKEFLRLRMVRCHRELKIDKPLCTFTSQRWQKALHLYCEFGTKGMVLEVRQRGGRYVKGSTLKDSVTFLWNDLLRAPSLTLATETDQQLRIATSITPPVQASYLLKCVPDRVSDDSGAMISDVILKMNQYRPQEGRWLSRTVLDHAGRECFVIRIRVGGGFWRRGGETPKVVKWEDRIIEIREGCWSYVAGSIGRAPEKIIGTSTPKEPPDGWHALWSLSTGDELLVRWGSLTSSSGLSFSLTNQQSTDSMVKLLEGRKMQYEVKKSAVVEEEENAANEKLKHVEDRKEDGFVTIVRCSEDNPIGKATALLNWKLLVVEFLAEEDAVFILLLCMSIVRSISEMKKEDVGRLLIRRRIKEAKLGDRDWGSVTLHTSSYSPSISSPHLQPWYWNANAVMGSQGVDDHIRRQPSLDLTEGGDKFYKLGIIDRLG